MVVEKAYSSLSNLNDIIKENLPSWVNVEESVQASFDAKKHNRYYIGSDNAQVSLFVSNDSQLSIAYVLMAVAAKNSDTNLNTTISNFGSQNSSNNAGSTSGKVRIVITEHAFGVILMGTNNSMKTGAVMAYKGTVNDECYAVFIGNDYTGTTSNAVTALVAQGMIDTNRSLRTIHTSATRICTIVPYCDLVHGFTEPFDDIYICYTIPTDGVPMIMKDNEGNTYYRTTAYVGADFPTIFIKA